MVINALEFRCVLLLLAILSWRYRLRGTLVYTDEQWLLELDGVSAYASLYHVVFLERCVAHLLASIVYDVEILVLIFISIQRSICNLFRVDRHLFFVWQIIG